jgi:hypothetical protein
MRDSYRIGESSQLHLLPVLTLPPLEPLEASVSTVRDDPVRLTGLGRLATFRYRVQWPTADQPSPWPPWPS